MAGLAAARGQEQHDRGPGPGPRGQAVQSAEHDSGDPAPRPARKWPRSTTGVAAPVAPPPLGGAFVVWPIAASESRVEWEGRTTLKAAA